MEAKLEFIINELAAIRKDQAYTNTLLEEIKSKGVRAAKTTTSASATPAAKGPVFPFINYHRWATSLYAENPEKFYEYIFVDDNTEAGKKANDEIRKAVDDFQKTDAGYLKAKSDKTRNHKTFQKLWKILPKAKKDALRADFENIKAEFNRNNQQPAIPETANTPNPAGTTDTVPATPTDTVPATDTATSTATDTEAGKAKVPTRRIRRRGGR